MIIAPESCGTETRALQGGSENLTRWKAIDGTHVRMKETASESGDLARWKLVSIEVNQHERYDVFAGTLVESVSHVDCKRSKSTSHRARTSQDYCNSGLGYCMFSHRHGWIDLRTSTKRS